ncbi:MAG: UPF0182 family protein, partial [Chloroflexi bacterium]|nr:UPF0182 family protein [Chloroflexota bacterium]
MSGFDFEGQRGRRDLGPPPPPFRIHGRDRGPLGKTERWLLLAGLAGLLLLAANIFKDVYIDSLWFESVGFSDVYFTALITRAALFGGAALIFLLFFGGNLLLARRMAPRIDVLQAPPEEIAAMRQLVTLGVVGAALFLAVIFGSIAAGEFDAVLRFGARMPFPKADPIFGQNIAFYVFDLPLARFVQLWAIGVTLITLVGTSALYAFSLSLQRSELTIPPALKAHLSAVAALLLLLFAAGNLLDSYELLFSRHNVLYGASFTDVNARLLAYRLMAGVGALTSALLLINIFLRGVALPIIGIGLWGIVFVLSGLVYPEFVQRVQVQPNEQTREAPYITYNIQATREAFGLDRIEERPFPAEERIQNTDLVANPQTVDNIRLWDHEPLKDTYNQIQSIRLYYDFVDVDIDRYTVNGAYRQVMLGARELSLEKLAATAQTWVNQRLQFTHGYGVTMSPVNEFSAEGLPTLWIKDVPPQGVIPIERPEIYYGEKTNHYVIVKTGVPEFDYPKEDQNATSFYQADSGVPLNSLFRRMMFAWAFADANLVLTEQLRPESRVLFERNVRSRVGRIAPFLTLDRDPYIVINNGRLVWMLDAYTTSNRYPYSEPQRAGFNYVRNSVKVTVDAYDGSVKFYMADPDDPLVQTYARIYPGMFLPYSEMPPGLKSHIRYPEDLFNWQADTYRVYHMQDPQVFYNKEDAYDRPREIYLDKEQPMTPYYVIMHLPDNPRSEFLLMLPFTPVNKNNTIAWLAARADGEEYGKLLAYNFPKDRLVFGPLQIESRINQDPAISRELTLWSQAGSRVLRGNLLMIPIDRSFIYVEPIYLQSDTSQLPELKRVIVASGNTLVMEPSLQEALVRLFGSAAMAGMTPR